MFWFTSAYKQKNSSIGFHGIMLVTDANESSNASFESCDFYVMSRARKMDVVKLVQLLQKMDGNEAGILHCRSGLQYRCIAGWKRLLHKRRRGVDEIIVLDVEEVCSS